MEIEGRGAGTRRTGVNNGEFEVEFDLHTDSNHVNHRLQTLGSEDLLFQPQSFCGRHCQTNATYHYTHKRTAEPNFIIFE